MTSAAIVVVQNSSLLSRNLTTKIQCGDSHITHVTVRRIQSENLRVAVKSDVGVVDAVLAESVAHPLAGHGCGHQRYDVAHSARQLKHDHHQCNYGRRKKKTKI